MHHLGILVAVVPYVLHGGHFIGNGLRDPSQFDPYQRRSEIRWSTEPSLSLCPTADGSSFGVLLLGWSGTHEHAGCTLLLMKETPPRTSLSDSGIRHGRD
jgi:hypothetical protein